MIVFRLLAGSAALFLEEHPQVVGHGSFLAGHVFVDRRIQNPRSAIGPRYYHRG
jgi:hypothetical protein